MMSFEYPRERANIIKVIGVGGGGGNAVNHMFEQGIRGVDFVICNTDVQALEASVVPVKLPIGSNITGGLGAGANPEVGQKAAMESIEAVVETLGINTKMVFITAGMGGGTGTGAAPIIAKTARDLGILTVGIVTTPFKVEGHRRRLYAEEGLKNMKDAVDCLLVINNDKILELHGSQKFSVAFGYANNILTMAAKGIAEIITTTGYINVDFEDVRTVMTNSGVALMGTAEAEGDLRALNAIEAAMTSPLLNNNKIRGAKNILLHIISGTGESEAQMEEIQLISDYVQREAEITTDIILGLSHDEKLGNKICVTIIATGFEPAENKPQPPVTRLDFEEVSEIKVSEPPAAKDPLMPEVHPLAEQIPPSPVNHQENMELISPEEEAQKLEQIKQRIQELKRLNQQLQHPASLDELYQVPAYVRKNVMLDQVPHSSEQGLSRVSLFEDKEEKKPELRKDNKYLHDNVD